MADTEQLLLSKLNIGGQLYQLKDSELTTKVNTLETQVDEIETRVDNHDTQIYALQQELGGLSNDTVAEIAKIVDELEGTENETTRAFVTLVDKLKGIEQDTVADHVDDKITAFATEIIYQSAVENVFVSDNEHLAYDDQTETLNITPVPRRLFTPDAGAKYDQNS